MAQRQFELKLSGRTLLIGLLVTVVPVSLLALFAVTSGSTEMSAAVSSQRRTLAQSVASQIRALIQSKVIEANLMASDSAVVEAAQSASRANAALSISQIEARIDEVEEVWNTPAGSSRVQSMLSSPGSRALQRKLNVDQQFLRITVTDDRGATIAASHKTVDYFQADEDYWLNIYADGRGAISLTDVLYDEASQSNLQQVFNSTGVAASIMLAGSLIWGRGG